ncbi:hypothetical protein CEUSTIGMA_g9450.t1 [Chlamydomonas eustigma]|uniref:Uncharacterized protein n=1 Tax=Chlamydomonas eustigma TaxID=1157962 RepID=A0A250XGH6_9CHLO|nr:hypothetical protein CEUSTIGMA_g9450.t1 [Chlamydomonas eustigma]|eukprot:GAX82022.1 hypothetical protein CEUSTIGMA_g9450.t1 [Chlamydomonas eustigma]
MKYITSDRHRHSTDEEDVESEEAELGEEEEEEEDGNEPGPSGREHVYDVEGMHEKLEDICWVSEGAWEETLMITNKDDAFVENVDDDLARELAFYNQALTSTHEAIRRFESAGSPWLRPTDYYAEMVKTDQHMAKVKEQLMFEQKQIELAEERRKQREQKQYSKQVQAERIKEKAQDKKRQIDSISKLRKSREKSGFAGELDYDAEIKNLDKGRQMGSAKVHDRNRPGGKNSPQVNKKRQAKNAKFGFGGSKRIAKQNDAYSSASMDGYKAPGKFSSGKQGKGKGVGLKAKGGVKKARPGKAKRQNIKGKSSR